MEEKSRPTSCFNLEANRLPGVRIEDSHLAARLSTKVLKAAAVGIDLGKAQKGAHQW